MHAGRSGPGERSIPAPAPVFFSVDGERLAGEHFAPAGTPRGAVVLVHGFNSSRGEFGSLSQRLAGAGYHALAFDQRGYGASQGERGRTSVQRCVEDIAAAAQLLTTFPGVEGLRMGIVGHSLGADYALAAMGRTNLFAAGVVAHPFDRLMDQLNPIERLGYHVIGKYSEWRVARGKVAPTIPYKNSYETLYESPEAAAAARKDGFLQGRVSLANYRPAVEMSAASWAREVQVPTLVIGSPHDRAVRPAHIRHVYEAIPATKQWLEHNGGHSCFRDLDGDVLAAATVDWFNHYLGPA